VLFSRLILLAFFFSPGAFGKDCQIALEEAIHKTATHVDSISLHSPSGLRPLSAQDYSKAEAAYKVYDEKFPVLGHIKGDFKYLEVEGKIPQVKLDGGLHTSQGVDFFKKARPDIADQIKLIEHPNGLLEAELPEAAFFEYKFKRLTKTKVYGKVINGVEVKFTRKTLFPKKWSDSEILKAIDSIKNDKANFVKTRVGDGGNEAQIYKGFYNKVQVEMVIQDGKVLTAYPVLD
jgi:hypothetical protein